MDMSADEFRELKVASRADPECLRFRDGGRAIPRSGASVGQHFSHVAGQASESEPETSHHILAKRVIRDVARTRGWEAEIEARHPDGIWQADVLVSGYGRRIAFEVQWSPQTLEDYQRRTDRYRDSGIETVWLAKYSARTWTDIESAVPALPFRNDAIGDGLCERPLDHAIDECLQLFEDNVHIPDDAQTISKARCYKDRCRKPFYFHSGGTRWGEKVPFSDDEQQVLGKWCATLRTDYSYTIGTWYPMWHCPFCGAKQGDFLLDAENSRVLVDGKLVKDTRGMALWRVLRGDVRRQPIGAGVSPSQMLSTS